MDGEGEEIRAYIDESHFTMQKMREKNADSMYLDGIEKIEGGILYYTDELVEKSEKALGIKLMKAVHNREVEKAAKFLAEEVIEKTVSGWGAT